MRRVAAGLLPLLLALFALVGYPGRAEAHAVLQRSSPPNGAILKEQPRLVMLQFNEPVESEFAPIVVRDEKGRQVDSRDAALDRNNKSLAVVSVPPGLASGFYTATYRVVSLDGHIIQGVVAFSVGTGIAPTAAAQPSPGVPWYTSLLHGSTLGLSIFLAGLVWFLAFIWRAAAGEPAPPAVRLGLVLTALLVVAALAEFVMYAVRLSGESLSVGMLWQTALTRTGRIMLARVLIGLMAGAAASFPAHWWEGRAWLPALVPGGALLASFSMLSHAAASGQASYVIADWVHLAAAAIWAGGLIGFTGIALPSIAWRPQADRDELLGVTVPRFSGWAILAVVAIIATGTYAAMSHLPSWDALLVTSSGRYLLAKIVLMLPLLALGAYNLRRKGQGAFKRALLAEIALMAAILTAAGFLASVPPASVEMRAQQANFSAKATADGVELELRINPLQIGVTNPVVTVRQNGAPLRGANVGLRLLMLGHGHDMGTQNADTKEEAPGVYRSEQVAFGMEGLWGVEVVILTQQGKEVRHQFQVYIPLPG